MDAPGKQANALQAVVVDTAITAQTPEPENQTGADLKVEVADSVGLGDSISG